jgi:hypothetical protein
VPKGSHPHHLSSASHPRWNSARLRAQQGYIKVRVGRNHPLADPNGYAYEHLLVWCAAGNARPPVGYILHHRNGIKEDNRLDNLELLTRAEHNRLHNLERGRDASGRFVNKKMRAQEA